LGGFSHSQRHRTHLQNARILDWVRISDESRCQLASIRLGRNSSVRSLPLKLRVPITFRVSSLNSRRLVQNKHTPQCHFIENSYFNYSFVCLSFSLFRFEFKIVKSI